MAGPYIGFGFRGVWPSSAVRKFRGFGDSGSKGSCGLGFRDLGWAEWMFNVAPLLLPGLHEDQPSIKPNMGSTFSTEAVEVPD